MIYTIGHSNHAIDRFLDLLSLHQVTAVADVRSSPYSRHNSRFNRETLEQSVAQRDVRYVFLGEELGARSKGRPCYDRGKEQRIAYEEPAESDARAVIASH